MEMEMEDEGMGMGMEISYRKRLHLTNTISDFRCKLFSAGEYLYRKDHNTIIIMTLNPNFLEFATLNPNLDTYANTV